MIFAPDADVTKIFVLPVLFTIHVVEKVVTDKSKLISLDMTYDLLCFNED